MLYVILGWHYAYNVNSKSICIICVIEGQYLFYIIWNYKYRTVIALLYLFPIL